MKMTDKSLTFFVFVVIIDEEAAVMLLISCNASTICTRKDENLEKELFD